MLHLHRTSRAVSRFCISGVRNGRHWQCAAADISRDSGNVGCRAVARQYSDAAVEFKQRVDSKELAHNAAQLIVLERLDSLSAQLARRDAASNVSASFTSWFGFSKKSKQINKVLAPRSIYIHGSVGVGKTFAADLWLKNLLRAKARLSSGGSSGAASSGHALQRWHFHSFMLHVHQQLHILRKEHRVPAGDQLRHLALTIANDVSLVSPAPFRQPRVANCWAFKTQTYAQLFFDEFQVSDVGDAMIMQRLFSLLLDNGVILVATSNRAPEGLYENGLNRELFLPFISMLQQRCEVLDVDALATRASHLDSAPSLESDHPAATPPAVSSQHTQGKIEKVGVVKPITHDRDYRLRMTGVPDLARVALPGEARTETFVRRVASASAGAPFSEFSPIELSVGFGRKMRVVKQHSSAAGAAVTSQPASAGGLPTQGTAVMTFAELCGKPVGAGDFYAIANAFHTLVLVDIPRLTLNEANQARRFITLVDVLYEAKVRTVFISSVPLESVLDGVRLTTSGDAGLSSISSQLSAGVREGLATTSGGGVTEKGRGSSQYSDSQAISLDMLDTGDDGRSARRRSLGGQVTRIAAAAAPPTVPHTDSMPPRPTRSKFSSTDTSLGAPGSSMAGLGAPVSMRVASRGGASSAWGTTMIGDVEWSATGRMGVSLAELSGMTDVAFAMHRALSRLTEMQSLEYIRAAAVHRPEMGLDTDSFLSAVQTEHKEGEDPTKLG